MPKFLPISWQELQDTCLKIYKKIKKQNLDFDRIVCISRGGLVVARIFSDFLDLPISNFTVISYGGINDRQQPKIVEHLQVDIKNERILLIDEIVDTGDTFKLASDYLKSKQPAGIISLSPFIKPQASPQPDLWQVKTDKWVIFPYEIKETILDLQKMFSKQGLNAKQINQKLVNLGFTKKYLLEFLSESLNY